METTELEISKDLRKFIDKFKPYKFKMIASGVQIRSINDLHRNITVANDLIEQLNLNLTVSHNAKMLSYRGFEVHNKSNAY